MFQTKVVEKIKTHLVFKIIFPKIVPFFRKVKKYDRARQTIDENIIR
jgi:hypothetical protein